MFSSPTSSLVTTSSFVRDLFSNFSASNSSCLWVHFATLRCAQSGCVACLYKTITPDVTLDSTLTSNVKNVRPEQCPRSCSRSSPLEIFKPADDVLTVGDGDLSFTASLSIMSCLPKKITGTVYETLDTIISVYGDEIISGRLAALREKGVGVQFSVDATNFETETTPSKIFWNFPCTAEEKGQDGQNQQMESNKQMLRAFAKECDKIWGDNVGSNSNSNSNSKSNSNSNSNRGKGEIDKSGNVRCDIGSLFISHKTKPPYNQWSIIELITESSSQLEYSGSFIFDKTLFPTYTNRKALDKKSFTMNDAVCHVFRRRGEGGEDAWRQNGFIQVDRILVEDLRKSYLNNSVEALSGVCSNNSNKQNKNKNKNNKYDNKTKKRRTFGP